MNEKKFLKKLTHIKPFEAPKDCEDIFEIGGCSFKIDNKQTSLYIGNSKYSRTFIAHLVAHAIDVRKAQKKKIIYDFNDDGEVVLSFALNGIYHNGVPTANLYFEENKCERTSRGIDEDGFDTSEFSGEVTLRDGWVGYNGYLWSGYDYEYVFPVNIAKQFKLGALAWKHYRFSFKEALQADPKVVRYLTVDVSGLDKFPTQILEFFNLKELNIHTLYNAPRSQIGIIPEEIGELKSLKTLSISGTSIEGLPESIGSLKKLKSLSIQDNSLTSLPESIGRLTKLKSLNFSDNCLISVSEVIFTFPKLEYLWLSGNKINEIRSRVSLPSIRLIDLKNNELTTLPESLALQSSTPSLELKGNPLESLPLAYDHQIKNMDLSIDDKKRLLDFSYLGADGKGLSTWDDGIYFALDDASLMKPVVKAIEKQGLGKYSRALSSLVKKSIGFSYTGSEDYANIGNHRFGGMPDLPENIAYPTFGDKGDGTPYFYEFLAQINCNLIAELQDYLPRTGILYFFLESFHNVYGAQRNVVKVIHCSDDEKLISGQRLNFHEDDYYEMFEPCYKGFKADTQTSISSPDFSESRLNTYLFSGDAESLKNERALLSSEELSAFSYSILNLLRCEHQINAYANHQNESPEHEASLILKGTPEDWIILLTVSSAEDFRWSDSGDLFFVIHKSDLAKQDFSNVFCTFDSG